MPGAIGILRRTLDQLCERALRCTRCSWRPRTLLVPSFDNPNVRARISHLLMAPTRKDPDVRSTEVTRALDAVLNGEPCAAEQLLPLVYDELRRLAAARLAQEEAGQTLQATALVHEAYLRLASFFIESPFFREKARKPPVFLE